MQKIFNPKSVAIIGASEKEGKIGNILMKNIKTPQNLRTSDFDPLYAGGESDNEVKVFPVNPKGGEIEGLEVHTSVLEIEEEIDLAVVAVPAKFVNKVVEECAWREQKIQNIIIISAGFGEVGEEGLKRKEELGKLVKEYDLNILGPNCLGIINASKSINLSFAKKEIISGGIGLISQSGAFITSMIDTKLGFSLIASLGNKIDISENELLEYYAQDKNTKIIAIYLESIFAGAEFQNKLKEVTKIKPVVIIKAGRSSRTKQAIQSHTGSMAGESAVIETAIQDAGGILVDNLEDFVTILNLLSNFKTPENKLVIVTNAGGPGVITTDLIEDSSLQLFEFNEEQKKQLQNNLPEESSVNNPIDLLGDAQEDRYQNTFNSLKDIKKIGGVLALITPQSQTPIELIIETVVNANKKAPFPIWPVVIGGEAEVKAEKICQKYGINNFKFPGMLVRALASIYSAVGDLPEDDNVTNSENINEDISSEQAMPKMLLSYEDSKKISEEFGLNTLPAEYPGNNVELRTMIEQLKLPMVMKVDSPNIIHKNEKNGVVVGLDTIERVEAEFERFQKDFPGEKILIQHQVKAGLEIILGLKRDESFGLVLVIGLGGITTEILNEKILFVGEATKEIIKNKLKISKLIKIFKKEKIAEDSLVSQAEKLFKLGKANPEIKEVDVNPMFFYREEEPVIVDFKIII